MNNDEEDDAIKAEMKRLQPAGSGIDPRLVFYQAGFSAGKSQRSASSHFKIAPLIAAGLLAAIVTAPTGYHMGHSAAMKSTAPSSVTVVSSVEPHRTPAALQPPEQAVEVASSRAQTHEMPARSQTLDLFASWIDPLHDLAQPMKAKNDSGTTLAVFHSSLLEGEKFSSSPSDFPFPVASALDRDLLSNPFGAGFETPYAQPLAAGDYRELAMTPETAR